MSSNVAQSSNLARQKILTCDHHNQSNPLTTQFAAVKHHHYGISRLVAQMFILGRNEQL